MRNAWSRMRNVAVGLLVAKAMTVAFNTSVKAGQLCCIECSRPYPSATLCCSDDQCDGGGELSCIPGLRCYVECNDGQFLEKNCWDPYSAQR